MARNPSLFPEDFSYDIPGVGRGPSATDVAIQNLQTTTRASVILQSYLQRIANQQAIRLQNTRVQIIGSLMPVDIRVAPDDVGTFNYVTGWHSYLRGQRVDRFEFSTETRSRLGGRLTNQGRGRYVRAGGNTSDAIASYHLGGHGHWSGSSALVDQINQQTNAISRIGNARFIEGYFALNREDTNYIGMGNGGSRGGWNTLRGWYFRGQYRVRTWTLIGTATFVSATTRRSTVYSGQTQNEGYLFRDEQVYKMPFSTETVSHLGSGFQTRSFGQTFEKTLNILDSGSQSFSFNSESFTATGGITSQPRRGYGGSTKTSYLYGRSNLRTVSAVDINSPQTERTVGIQTLTSRSAGENQGDKIIA